MDDIDIKIIELLRHNARMTNIQIANSLNVSEGTIRKRIKKLKEKSVIKRFTIDVNNMFSAVIGIHLDPKTPTRQISEKVKEIGMTRLFEVTGRYDMMVMIDRHDPSSTNDAIEQIRALQGVRSTETFTVLGSH